jgi:hypothetical protein
MNDAEDVDVTACHAVRDEERSARDNEFTCARHASRPTARGHMTEAVDGSTDPGRHRSRGARVFSGYIGMCLFEVGNGLARIANPQT